MRPRRAVLTAVVLGGLSAASLAPTVLAHGDEALPAPSLWSFVLDWQLDPSVWLPAIAAVVLWLAGARAIGRAGRGRVSHARTAAWLAGVAAILVALQSGIGRYDDTLFSDHMVQHLLLTLIAPPLLVWAGPMTLVLQVATPAVRRRWILPLLHARVLSLLVNPVVAGVGFALVMWGTHLSPLYEASLEQPALHDAEHAAYLVSALLLWWPAIGRDPAPWRLGPAAGALYLGLQMPQMAFLAVSILMAPAPLYPAYAEATRTWGPTPLADQQLAAGLMWVAGSLVFVGAVVLMIARWMIDDERRASREERRLDAADAARVGAAAPLDGPANPAAPLAHPAPASLRAGAQPSAGTDAARYSR